MTFVSGRALFLSVHRNQGCWPEGTPHRVMIGTKAVMVPGREVQFDNHRYATEDAALAEGLILDKDNFTAPGWGWSVDAACLPSEFKDIWNLFDRETKRKIALALVEGQDPTEIFDALTAEEIAPTIVPEAPAGVRLEHVCPVSGCGIKIEGSMDAVKASTALLDHVRLMHPDWGG